MQKHLVFCLILVVFSCMLNSRSFADGPLISSDEQIPNQDTLSTGKNRTSDGFKTGERNASLTVVGGLFPRKITGSSNQTKT